ncbi:17-beta-hydroxysteroid dehydrogenase type 6 [Trichonephila clavipes]|nr:17-beta-hydroxysteroid dehydrogenase type 6 [Trichonephila clavipes]
MAILSFTLSPGKKLWAVVNNAGVIERGEVEWTPLEVYRKHFEVNVFGVVSVTQAFLPLLRKYKGRVVTVTSIAGRLTFSGLVPYSMSKHAARSFCEGLRLEMKKFGVKVITVEPFAHRTGMTEMSTVLKSVQDTWNKFSGKCKNDVYDENYIQAFNESILKFTEATTLPDISRVIDSLVEAVCTVSPHYSYIPGNSEVKELEQPYFRLPAPLVPSSRSHTSLPPSHPVNSSLIAVPDKERRDASASQSSEDSSSNTVRSAGCKCLPFLLVKSAREVPAFRFFPEKDKEEVSSVFTCNVKCIMAFLLRERKDVLLEVAKELRVEIDITLPKIEFKNRICQSEDYNEESVKSLLEGILAEKREARELKERQEARELKERQEARELKERQETREYELEWLRLSNATETVSVSSADLEGLKIDVLI